MKNYCVSCDRMKQLEALTDEAGLSYYQMMENAGRIASHRIIEITAASPICDEKSAGVKRGTDSEPDVSDASGAEPSEASKAKLYPYALKRPLRARIYCGKGNNGGDGLVVARRLKKEGWDVQIVLVEGLPVTEDGKRNYDRIKDSGIPVADWTEESGEEMPDINGCPDPDVIVDAIYGTGFHGKLRSRGVRAAEEIAMFRERGARVFALDIPSGMGGDLLSEGELDPCCVKADHTIAFHAAKPVHLQGFAREYCGQIMVADIGITDPDRDDTEEGSMRGSHKGNRGEFTEGESHDFGDFVEIVSRLRAPDGCVWDRAQTHETLKKYLIEETREALDAIDSGDDANLCEELGDVLLQIVLHAQIASERDAFTIENVIQGISDKMIRRHPWVFGDMEIDSIEENVNLWEEIKRREKEDRQR